MSVNCFSFEPVNLIIRTESGILVHCYLTESREKVRARLSIHDECLSLVSV